MRGAVEAGLQSRWADWALGAVTALLALLVGVCLLSGPANAQDPGPGCATATPTGTATASPTETATASPTSTAGAEPTSTPTAGPTVNARSAAACSSPSATATASATPAATPTQTPAPFVSAPPAAVVRGLPVIRTSGSYTAKRTRFERVLVTAERGFRVEASCSRRACKATRSAGRGSPVRVKRMERAYPPGVVLTIRVIAPDATGKLVRIQVRRGRPPLRSDRCLGPGGAKTVACGAS